MARFTGYTVILSMQSIFKTFLMMAVATALIGSAPAQSPTPAPSTSGTPAPSATPAASPTPLPLADVTTLLVAAEEARSKIDAEMAMEKTISATNDAATLSSSRLMEAALAKNTKTLAADPSLETIRDLEAIWQNFDETHTATKRSLTERIKQCDDNLARLDKMGRDWAQQATLAKSDNGTPPELRKRMESMLAPIEKSRAAVQKRRGELVLQQPAVEKQERQIDDMIALIKKTQIEAVGRLFVAESLPLWSEPVRLSAGVNLMQGSSHALATHWAVLRQYVQAQSAKFLGHGFLFVALLTSLYWTRKRVRVWAEDEPSLKRAAQVFEDPLSMAFAFSLLAAVWIYPQPPQLLMAIGGAAALIPAILILRRLVDRHLFPVLNAMVVFYFIDQLRTVAAPLPALARLLFVAELAGGGFFLAWLLRTGWLDAMRQEDERLSKVAHVGTRIALGIFAAALISNIIGCVLLGNLLGNAVLRSGYLAVILYAATRIADGLILGGLSTEPLAGLRMVQRHRTLIWRRTHRTLQAVAFILWVYGTLDMLALRSFLMEGASAFLFSANKKEAYDLTLVGQLLSFGLIVWASVLLSRFARFALEEDFYPRMQMERGLSYAVSTMLHYVVLLIGFYTAASAVGVDMTKFTILAGAFGVGMGFGLQNIINNFVSGVILLFERPIKVGDVVQMDGVAGTVDRIGIRASIIRTGSGSEIIVPNAKLISEQVVNWTLSNRQRSIDIPVTVAYGIDPCRVISLLKNIATAHPLVATKPAPNALLTDLAADAVHLKLSAWTDHCEQWGQIRSDLAIAINEAFLKEDIRRPSVPAPAPVQA